MHLLLLGLVDDVELGGVHQLALFLTDVLASKLNLPGKISSRSDVDASLAVLDVLVDDDDDIVDIVVDVVIGDDFNLIFSIPDLVNSFLVAEDDNMSAILLAQFPKGRVCRAKADGSVDVWMSSLRAPWWG